ncbi:hypothetical protein [Streptomyces sp. NPDC048357]|uniref:hypothetical protein n=1 Tax=Streptomyces sp. NPDC048357 TaxID=3154719 RepID=UPI003434CD03
MTVTDTTGRHPALGLPGARPGLLDLRERAEHLGGALSHVRVVVRRRALVGVTAAM